MAKAITKFAANDGTEFNTEAEALAHDARNAAKEEVEQFITGAKVHKTHAGYLRRMLPAFLAWKATGVLPSVEVAEEAPAEA